ncbi:MAG: chromosome partitioning protein ParA [Candidatus Jacksonbacteria bacterium RIFOXYC2_FULL_44_29]|nr:MAG: chromosome partitioning protein ParA [Candidatus Jacksonbacteria bacterium RIFOXYA2_FULL_43_12]OGY77775.1 MAG: chromosome partitioning protein ParA [Candidatus Jacksonbacteria bacterium RIFOXYB2_FULL_44_15]OGY78925.1 MAG: chromosome partitioning protein ParA [Candidatus Jacksonbacteria bacterium RIFOXYD2_FULL_43_21]OGY79146.1 MAG: chromosome partitioning protein ParA [Candidatus Jacksonbacteria bacterium RIFOXYC2_FULL_44_29]HBH46943.1 chromosome partitioning protein ParA [Candidatus Jac
MPTKIISVVNQKGGVGKTTTAINLASYLAYFNQKTLLVDIDPQANATSGLGINHKQLDQNIYHAIIAQTPVDKIILGGAEDRLHLAPSGSALAGANIELVDHPEREFRLKSLIQTLSGYDYIIIDCPPSLGLLTINGLVAAEEILIPIQAEYYALEGLGQLLETINLIKEHLKPDLNILGALITMYDKRTLLAREVLAELQKYFPDKILKSVIPRSIRLAEAPSYGQPILNYDATSAGALAYHELAQEILQIHAARDAVN